MVGCVGKLLEASEAFKGSLKRATWQFRKPKETFFRDLLRCLLSLLSCSGLQRRDHGACRGPRPWLAALVSCSAEGFKERSHSCHR
jgi:hypothetical protein